MTNGSNRWRAAVAAAAWAWSSFAGAAEPVDLPAPFATPSVKKTSKVIGWPEGRVPTAPSGFRVNAFAADLTNPRWLYVLPNGDVLVAQSRTPEKEQEDDPQKKPGEKAGQNKVSLNRIALLRDADRDGEAELRETFAENLNQPFGMALVGDRFFVANQDGVLSYPFRVGQTRLEGKPLKIVELPAGGYNNHWTRNLLAGPRGDKLYISVGSGSNVAEHGMNNEILRANILEANLDGTGLRVFASGLRNPVGMAWEPHTGALWTAVNERDELGDDLVPDYITSVKDGAFYGWPYAYFGDREDPRRKDERPDLVKKSLAPDHALGAHTASLGIVFNTGDDFPDKYRGGAFVTQRGSWNRSKFAGYKVVFVPFREGKPAGETEDFLTGFVKNDDEVFGRPIGIAFAGDGSLLVSDEPSNRVWRVSVAR